jgi:hypothetical protein
MLTARNAGSGPQWKNAPLLAPGVIDCPVTKFAAMAGTHDWCWSAAAAAPRRAGEVGQSKGERK